MISRKLCAVNIAAIVAFGAVAQALPAQAQNMCVAYRDVRQIHMIDTTSAVFATPRGDYKVTFRTACTVEQRGEFFILDRFRLGQCVAPGDLFESSGTSAPCTIESVEPLRDLIQDEGE